MSYVKCTGKKISILNRGLPSQISNTEGHSLLQEKSTCSAPEGLTHGC